MPVKRALFSNRNRRRFQQRLSSRLDFAWEKGNPNPYNHQNNKLETNKKRKIKILIGLFALILTITLLLLNPLFQIKEDTIEITGLKQISTTEFTNAVRGILGNPIAKFLPRNNYLLLDINELKEILLNRFPVLNIKIHKIFPNSLLIEVTEKPPVILFDNGYTYATVGANGDIVDLLRSVGQNEWLDNRAIEIVTSTITTTTTNDQLITLHRPIADDLQKSFPDFPLIFEPIPKPLHINAEIFTPKFVEQILFLHRSITKSTNVPIHHISLIKNNLEADIETGEGWHIKVSLDEDLDEQLKNLSFLLRDKNFPRPNLKYVDLRFKAHIFWQ